MSFFSSLLLGIVQGITEFLPISSSGHLAIAQNLLHLNTEVPAYFDVLLHLGTLIAVFAAYWKDICEIILEAIRGVQDIVHHETPNPVPPARRMILLIIIATFPLFIILPFHKKIQALADNLTFIGAALVVTGFVLFALDIIRRGRKTEKTATVLDVIVVGIAQAIATMPGISRSGMTVAAGSYLGFERSFAVRFSFLMSIPAILGANILSLKDALEEGVAFSGVYFVGFIAAAVVGYLCICLLRYIATKGKFAGFSYYCWAVGLLTLFLNIIF